MPTLDPTGDRSARETAALLRDAALALPLIGLAARLHAEMRRFDDAGVDR